MVWKGEIIKESLEDNELLELAEIKDKTKKELERIGEEVTFIDVEVEEEKKDEFVQKAIKKIKSGFYIYLVKEGVMYVIFKDSMFKFTKGFPEMQMAKEKGIKFGIPEKDMPFEDLLKNPWNV